MLHRNLKAFTLLELLVGMILSGIVLTATFTAYKIVSGQYKSYRYKSESMSELSFFVSQLHADFSNATIITRNSENEIQLQSEKRMLLYRFSEKYVLRNDLQRTDTFKVSVTGIETLWKTEKVNSENAALDELHVLINFEGKKEEKIYLKVTDPKSGIDKNDADIN